MNFSSWPTFSKKELNVIEKIITSGKVNYWTNNYGKDFEKNFSNFFSCNHAIAVANGSVALDIALEALEIKAGDEVIVTPRSYIASASCIVKIGAKPIFADIDLESQNITADSIEQKITKKTKAVICVHLGGWPCDMNKILNISKKYKISIIEDCSQSHGAEINGEKVGSFGHISTFSFCNDKIISTLGEGGMLLTNKKKLWRKMWSIKEHGKNYKKFNKKIYNNLFKWQVDSIGSNYRLTEIQSAVGDIQLKRLENTLKIRKRNANKLRKACEKFDSIRVPLVPNNIKHAYYRFYIFLKVEKLKKSWTRNKIIKKINDLGVPCFTGSCPEIYREKVFIDKKLSPKKRLSNAQDIGETSLAFLVDQTLEKKDLEKACRVIEIIFSQATK